MCKNRNLLFFGFFFSGWFGVFLYFCGDYTYRTPLEYFMCWICVHVPAGLTRPTLFHRLTLCDGKLDSFFTLTGHPTTVSGGLNLRTHIERPNKREGGIPSMF